MTSAELAARRYIAAWQHSDSAARSLLLEACFADHGRLMGGARVIAGRAALAAEIAAFLADPRGLRARVTSVIQASGEVFRFRAVVERRDGSRLAESVDVGEVDGDGRIVRLYTFAEPLRDAAPDAPDAPEALDAPSRAP